VICISMMENKLLNSFDLLDMSLNYKQIGSFAIVLGSPSTIAKEFMVNFEKWCNDLVRQINVYTIK